VYAVGHDALGNEGRWKAAVLACGEGAALSHTSAAALWGMLDPTAGPVHVTVPSQAGRRRRDGIRIHRCTTLLAGHTTVRARIRVTTPARTLADLRGTRPASEYRKALREAEFRHPASRRPRQ
jgi:predicted transcriptional regulator of viral defense system